MFENSMKKTTQTLDQNKFQTESQDNDKEQDLAVISKF